MSVTISSMDYAESYFGLGDMGELWSDQLSKWLGEVKGKDAVYLMSFVTLFEDATVTAKLATEGSDSVKALVGRTRGRANQLVDYAGKVPPEWLHKQTAADVLATATAATEAGVDISNYIRAVSEIAAAARKKAPSAEKIVKAADVTPVAVRTSVTAPASGGKNAAPAEAPSKGKGGTGRKGEGFLAAYWLPLTIVGVGSLAAITLALLDRPKRAAVAGLGSIARRRRSHRR